MWRGHGGGDGAVLGARSAHCSAEKGVMSGVFGPSSSRTVPDTSVYFSASSSPYAPRGAPLCECSRKPTSVIVTTNNPT